MCNSELCGPDDENALFEGEVCGCFPRRDFVQMELAAGAIWGTGAPWSRLAAQQALTQDDLLSFEPVGNVT